MNLSQVKRRCEFYRKLKMLEQEKILLETVLFDPKTPSDWEWGNNRMKEINPTFISLNEILSITPEPDITPVTQNIILQRSIQYQKEWRFEREKRLIEYAATLFPDWDYIHQRLEWLSRPTFHNNPEKSISQPRPPLNLPRNPDNTPLSSTINSLCFVTGASSNDHYMILCVQLLESIKATQWYNNIPIKILDCGLNEEDKAYLIQRFGAEVKDPGWDVNPEFIKASHGQWGTNGFKASMSRPFLHIHFPGFQYYFWLDADTWIQDENSLDAFIKLCEQQGMGVVYDCNQVWDKQGKTILKSFVKAIPSSYLETMFGKKAVFSGAYCISLPMIEKFASHYNTITSETKYFAFGVVTTILNYLFYKEIINGSILDEFYAYVNMVYLGGYIDNSKRMLTNNGQLIGLVVLCLHKSFPYRVLFSNTTTSENKKTDNVSKYLSQKDPALAEEASHYLATKYNWKQGSYFYRVYS